MDLRITTKEQEKLILENQKIIYYMINKLDVSKNDYEDLVSVSQIGLIKAAITYNDTLNIKFVTYASNCIKNEIYMYLRKERFYKKTISLYQSNNDIDDDLELIDILYVSEDAIEEIEKREDFENTINIILNCLNSKERYITLYSISGMNQNSIAKTMSYTQAYVSIILHKAIKKIKKYYHRAQPYNREFKMEKVENFLYCIIMSKQSFQEKIKSFENKHDIKIIYKKEKIEIFLPADLESFAIVAEIMREIEK